MKIYLAGHWKLPPVELCNVSEEHGHVVIYKWWVKSSDKAKDIADFIDDCDVYIIDNYSIFLILRCTNQSLVFNVKIGI